MTCIIGLVQDGKVYIGGDSGASDSYSLLQTNLCKVIKRSPFIMGYCGSFRMGQVLKHSLKVCEQESSESDLSYLVNEVMDSVRELYREKGILKITENIEEGGEFLLGYKGSLYSIESDFQVNSFGHNYHAIGCGSDYALGAMMALRDEKDPEKRILKSLEISGFFSNGVCAPYYVDSL